MTAPTLDVTALRSASDPVEPLAAALVVVRDGNIARWFGVQAWDDR